MALARRSHKVTVRSAHLNWRAIAATVGGAPSAASKHAKTSRAPTGSRPQCSRWRSAAAWADWCSASSDVTSVASDIGVSFHPEPSAIAFRAMPRYMRRASCGAPVGNDTGGLKNFGASVAALGPELLSTVRMQSYQTFRCQIRDFRLLVAPQRLPLAFCPPEPALWPSKARSSLQKGRSGSKEVMTFAPESAFALAADRIKLRELLRR